MPVHGDLETMPLVELLQWAGANRKTGILELERRKIRKEISFRDGRIVGCSSDDPATRLGQLLISNGKISRQTLADALRRQTETGQRLPDILVESGALTRREILDQVGEQAEEMISGMFEWNDAVFTFRSGGEPGRHSIEVDLSVERTLLDGARRQDELQRIRQVFPSRGIVLKRTERPLPSDLEGQAVVTQILGLLDEQRTLAEVLLRAHASEYNALSLLRVLHENGSIEIVGEREVDDRDGEPRIPLQELAEASAEADVENAIDRLLEIGGAASKPPGGDKRDPCPSAPDSTELEVLIRVASQKIDSGDHEGALAILEACYDERPADEAVRRQLRRAEAAYVESVGNGPLPPDTIPTAVEIPGAAGVDLTPKEASLLGLIDGQTTVESILWTAPLRPFQVLWTLQSLVDKGRIRLGAGPDTD